MSSIKLLFLYPFMTLLSRSICNNGSRLLGLNANKLCLPENKIYSGPSIAWPLFT